MVRRNLRDTGSRAELKSCSGVLRSDCQHEMFGQWLPTEVEVSRCIVRPGLLPGFPFRVQCPVEVSFGAVDAAQPLANARGPPPGVQRVPAVSPMLPCLVEQRDIRLRAAFHPLDDGLKGGLHTV